MLTKNKNNQEVLTEQGHEYLAHFVTDTKGPIYAFKESLSTAVAAASMARLSRCADDLRHILIKEFAPTIPAEILVDPRIKKEDALLQRVITAYGDDSVQQLAGLYVVVQAPSNLLTKLLERPRTGAAYLEQSTRYIFFDQKVIGENDQPHYRYITPPELRGELAEHYRVEMDKLFDNYSVIVRKLYDWLVENSSEPAESRDLAWRNAIRAQACDAARGVLPAATTSTVSIYASAQALDNLIMRLLGHPLQEARDTGEAILKEVRKVAPVFFQRTDMPERGGATTAYLRTTRDNMRRLCETTSTTIPIVHGEASVDLIDYWPKDETDILDSILFPFGYTSTGEDIPELFEQVVRTYAGERLNRRHKPGRMFEEACYTFEYNTSYAEFRDLQRHRLVSSFEWLELKPSTYQIPELIQKSGLVDLYNSSFSISRALWERLYKATNSTVAQYPVLFGETMTWSWTLNLREAMHIIELRTTPQGHPAYRKICQLMYEEIKRIHPVLAQTIKFVNCDEDPELTRLAAERATAFKLSLQNE